MNRLVGLLFVLVLTGSSSAQSTIDLRSIAKEGGVAIYCKGAPEQYPPANVRVTILNAINGSYALGTKLPIDLEIRNVGNTPMLVPIEPASEKLIKDKVFPLTVLEMCVHIVQEEEAYAERCLTGRVSQPDSFVELQPDHSLILRDTADLTLVNLESFSRAMTSGYTVGLSAYVTFSNVKVTSFPRKLYNDCFIPLGESDHSQPSSITIRKPADGERS